MRIRHINSKTKADIRPPVEGEYEQIGDKYNLLMVELVVKGGATVLSTEQEVVDGYITIVRKFDNGEEVHLIPNDTKVQ